MLSSFRRRYNQAFREEHYQSFLENVNALHPGALEFRISESPVFLSASFKKQVLDACEYMVDVITAPGFGVRSELAIPADQRIPGPEGRCQFIAFDFGICQLPDGTVGPQLIELQGFPTIFGYQSYHDQLVRKHFDIPEETDAFFNGHNRESYLRMLKDILLEGSPPEEVILLEIFPHQQKTKIDFYCTEQLTGVRPVCITEILVEGNQLFYMRDAQKQKISRIYNRVIFDELQQQPQEIQHKAAFLFQKNLEVSWVPHPNWFYRISKHTMPSLYHPNIPETLFLHELKALPSDLENYVLKPLFSFAGQGVIIDLTKEDIEAIKSPENFILQRKVPYASVIETPDGPAKGEIRIFYFWPRGASRPQAVFNLARMSKGKMIGVRYNADKSWVGGSIAYFEK